MAKTTTTPEAPSSGPLDFAEFNAEYERAQANAAATHARRLAALDNERRAEHASYQAERAATADARDAEINSRWVAVQRGTFERLSAPLAAFHNEDTRAGADEIARAWEASNAEAITLRGCGLDANAIPHVMANNWLTEKPELLGVIARQDFFADGFGGFGNLAGEAHRLLVAGAGAAALRPVLNALDAAMTIAVTRPCTAAPDAREQLDVTFWGGSPANREKTRAALEAANKARRVASNEAERLEIVRGRGGEDVPNKPAGWLESARKLPETLFGPLRPMRLSPVESVDDVELPAQLRSP